MAFKNYDPKGILISYNGIVIQGFGDGDFLTAEREEDTFTKITGADGDTTRVRSRNESGLVTLTLLAESSANDLMMLAFQTDVSLGLGLSPFFARNLQGTTLLSAQNAWIMKPPDVTYSKEGAGTREWLIECARLNMFVGGALV